MVIKYRNQPEISVFSAWVKSFLVWQNLSEVFLFRVSSEERWILTDFEVFGVQKATETIVNEIIRIKYREI